MIKYDVSCGFFIDSLFRFKKFPFIPSLLHFCCFGFIIFCFCFIMKRNCILPNVFSASNIDFCTCFSLCMLSLYYLHNSILLIFTVLYFWAVLVNHIQKFPSTNIFSPVSLLYNLQSTHPLLL